MEVRRGVAAECLLWLFFRRGNVSNLDTVLDRRSAMLFYPKISAVYTRRLKISSSNGSHMKGMKQGGHRKLYSFGNDPGWRLFPSPHSLLNEKALVFGGHQINYSSAESRTGEKTQLDDGVDFPQLLNVLPSNVRKDEKKISLFPLLNPWRIGHSKISGMMETEADAQMKRSKVLDKLFPSSNFPSVTRVLQATMEDSAKSALARWKEKMITDMGEVPFIQHQRKIFNRGSLLHKNIATKLTSPQAGIQVPNEIHGFWESLSHVFPEISEVKIMEHRVKHPFLCYSGVADCVAIMNDDLVLIDWKTSSRPKPDLSYLYDEPIQAVSYAGAVNFDHDLCKFHLEKVVIVIAYEDGSPADVHQLSHSHCRDYWKLWLLRLQNYFKIIQDNKTSI